MTRLHRLAKIASIVGKYRLDDLLDKGSLPFSIRALLAPAMLFGRPKGGRGERLRKALEDLGPIYIKLGQLLSTRPDLVPADICSELAALQDSVPPFSSAVFKDIVETSLRGSVLDLFQSFDTDPLASASVAQVHAAVLADGRNVVVKAVRPGIEKTIRKDIALMYTLAHLLNKYSADGRRLRPLDVVKDYEIVILDELNLQAEGANASLMRHNFDGSPLVYVPEIYWPYSNENLLVMERIYGIPVTNMGDLEAAGVDLKILAERGVEIFFTQVFEHNFFHADMHPGNIFVDASNPKSPSYIAIDCAIMGSLSNEDQFYLARCLLAIFKRDYRQVAELHIRSGWVPKDTPASEFAGAIRSVCEPIFQRPLSEISLGDVLVSLFNAARRFNMEVQPSLILLQKTLLNVEGLGRQMYPELDLWTTAQPFLERWLKERYSPKSVLKQFKRHIPDWLEQLPQIPPLAFQALKNLQETPIAPTEVIIEKTRSNRLMARLGAAVGGVGIGLAYPLWAEPITQIPGISLILVSVGLLMLLLR